MNSMSQLPRSAPMKTESAQVRAAYSILARQFGQMYVREGRHDQVRRDFYRVFPGDAEALEHFDAAVAEEEASTATRRRQLIGNAP